MSSGYKKYEPDVLQKLQAMEVDTLKKFREICDAHGLKFWAIGGSAIGAVRHKGFIPWDDDLDVGMLREDFDKLMALPDSVWGEDYEVFYALHQNEKHNMFKTFAKIVRKGTIFENDHLEVYQRRYTGTPYTVGIFLDVFPYDYTSPDREERKKRLKKAYYYKNLYFLANIKMLYKKGMSLKQRIKVFTGRLVYDFLSIHKHPDIYVYQKMMRKLKTGEKTEYVIPYTVWESRAAEGCCSKIDDLFPLQEVPFEDTTIYLPKNNHDSLTRIYGDYMQIPPEEKRYNHPPVVLDFGDGERHEYSD